MYQLQQWYDTPLGQRLKRAEADELNQQLQTLFGYYLLLTGSDDFSLVEGSRVRHRVILTQSVQPYSCAAIAGRVEELPIMTDTIDVIVLYHSLDFSENPHQVLREAERVLVPEGHIVIIGFNPRSLWGLRRWMPGKRANTPWQGKFVSMTRIKDWLTLLGFDLVDTQQLFYRPPINHEGSLKRLQFMESMGKRFIKFFGASYLITAKKKIAKLTPIKPRWRPQKQISTGLVDSASRNVARIKTPK